MKAALKRVPWLILWRGAVLALLVWIAHDLHANMPSDPSYELTSLSSEISRLKRQVDELGSQIQSLELQIQLAPWRRQ